MNPHHYTVLLPMLMMFTAFTICDAEEKKKAAPPVKPPAEAELRTTITKGLGFLAKEGEVWMSAKKCISCHHLPELLWSHREARRRGFPVDSKKLDEWLKWAVELAADKKPGTEEAAYMILAMPDRPAADLTKLLASAQKPDGSWNPANQFATMQKRGKPDAIANSTRLILIALDTPKPKSPDSGAARVKAQNLLQKNDSPTSIESLVFRTLYARKFDKPEEAKALCKKIIKGQRGDGGWSSFLGENMSDSLATGQALYILQAMSADPPTAQAIAKGQKYLLKKQRDDGGWSIDVTHISKVDRSSPDKAESLKRVSGIYTYWGSSWATIGLLESMPVIE